MAIYKWPVRHLRNLGVTLAAAGMIMLVGIGIWEALTWLPKISPGAPTYLVRRYLFSVVTMTDVPTIPVTLSGIALLISWRAKVRRRLPLQPAGESSAESAVQTTKQ
jgi:hypothetical protein